MTLEHKKWALLDALQEEGESLSLPELLKKLGPNYSERSTRRWLNSMITEGLVEKSGSKRATRYQAVQQTHLRRQSEVEIFSDESLTVIDRIRQPLFKRDPSTYNQAWYESYRPNETAYISPECIQQLHHLGKRAKNKIPAGTYARQIYNRLLIDLSYNSSRLEGNMYSLSDTERLIISGESATGKMDEEKVMILNHKEAIHHLISGAPKIKIDSNEICTLHYLLSDGLIAAKYSGKVRDHGVRISASTYIPYENPKQLEGQLINLCQKASQIKEPYEQSLFLLVHLSYLQAFADVNKRTARLSTNIPLIKSNLVPLSFNDIEKDDYASAMIAIYELNDVRPLIDLYLFSYRRTCLQYDTTVEAMGFDKVRVEYREERRAILRQIITKQLTADAIDDYIKTQVDKLIGQADQADFIEDVREDLHEMGPHQIVGLGVTRKQLDDWLKKIKR